MCSCKHSPSGLEDLLHLSVFSKTFNYIIIVVQIIISIVIGTFRKIAVMQNLNMHGSIFFKRQKFPDFTILDF